MRLVGPPILRKCIASPPPAPPSKPPTLAGKPLLTAPQNPCAQFFFAVNPKTPPENLTKLLNKAWQYDPITTLRLICYLRTLRGGRKASNDGFFAAALWLYKNHPLTLACNLREFAGFGSLRDFTEILYRLVKEEDCSFTCKVKDSSSRKETETEIARRAVCKYVQDSTYRFLHERVSDLFADLLISDLKSLGSDDVHLLSYASVDCPSIDSAYDRHTLLCESIARKVFPQESDPSYMEIKDEHYVYRVQNGLRKDVLSPMRMALKGRTQPEGERVQAEDYTLVFMKKAYQKLLKMKDNVSKLKYFQIILAMILKENTRFYPSIPLSVIASLNDDNIEAKELEWKNLVQSFSKERKLMNSVAVCDISEDMRNTTKNVSVSMGLLISELSNGPWKGTLYGFHQSPKLRKIEGDDLRSKLNSVKQLQCTNKVDVEAILNQLLQVAVSNNLSPEKMVERVFVFTNKDFRKGVNHYWGWNYNAVWGRYQKSGFHRVPEVVFWNIEGLSSSLPTTRVVFHNTVLTLNGFSRSLLAFFLNKEAILRSDEIKSVTAAEDVMQITLAGKEYQNLAVLD